MNRFVLKTLLKIMKKTMYLKVFLKTQRLCTISNGNANVTTLYTQNNEFERPKLMCHDLGGENDQNCCLTWRVISHCMFLTRKESLEFYFEVTDQQNYWQTNHFGTTNNSQHFKTDLFANEFIRFSGNK